MLKTIHLNKVIILILIFCVMGISQIVYAWPGVDSNGVAICTEAHDQYTQTIVSDGQGGAFIVWTDTRNGNDDIYAQAVDKNGTVKWTTNGVAICTAANTQQHPQVVPDNQGGAIIVWEDYRGGNWDIFAQAVDSTGALKWSAGGLPISTAASNQHNFQLVSDDQGGGIIAWQDWRNLNNDNIYVQKVDSTGAVQWTSDGVAVCTESHTQQYTKLISNGQGGAIIAWEDFRNGNDDLYAQAVDSTGTVQWTTDGVAVCRAANDQSSLQLVSNGQSGAIIVWQDSRNGNDDLYAQAVDSTGTMQWTVDGVAISTAASNQHNFQLVSDGQGGGIIAWQDYRNLNDDNIYVQKVNSTGAVQWTSDGVAVCTESHTQQYPKLISNGQGGAIIAWEDYRNGNDNLYAQAVDSTGTVQWTADGVAVCTAANDQSSLQLVSDGQRGAIIAWQDYRNDNWDIYSQSININGLVPVELSNFMTE